MTTLVPDVPVLIEWGPADWEHNLTWDPLNYWITVQTAGWYETSAVLWLTDFDWGHPNDAASFTFWVTATAPGSDPADTDPGWAATTGMVSAGANMANELALNLAGRAQFSPGVRFASWIEMQSDRNRDMTVNTSAGSWRTMLMDRVGA